MYLINSTTSKIKHLNHQREALRQEGERLLAEIESLLEETKKYHLQ